MRGVLLRELTADWPQEVKVIGRDAAHWVKTPQWEMSWSEAVQAGKIRF
jgi:hypothetical protein